MLSGRSLSLGILASLFFIFAPMHSTCVAASKVTRAKYYATDAAITTAVKAKYLAEKGLDSMDIKVKTVNGVVTIRGQVMEKSQVGLAEKIARETDGVRSVVNKLSVVP